MPVRDYTVHAPGLGDLRRSLGRIDRELRRDAERHIRAIASKVRGDARAKAELFADTGELARSLRYYLKRGGAGIYTLSEYAGVHEFGGTVSPRGTPITIEGKHYMGDAAKENTRDVEDEIARLLDAIAPAQGFHGGL